MTHCIKYLTYLNQKDKKTGFLRAKVGKTCRYKLIEQIDYYFTCKYCETAWNVYVRARTI